MIRKVCSIALIVLAMSPLTAPFASCDLVDILHGYCGSESAATLQAPLLRSLADSEALVVPPLTTKTGHVQLPVAATPDCVRTVWREELIPTATPAVHDLVLHFGPPPAVSVLRV